MLKYQSKKRPRLLMRSGPLQEARLLRKALTERSLEGRSYLYARYARAT